MKRGEIWWAELPEPSGKRPVLLLSRDASYGIRTLVTVAMITRTIRVIPSEVPVGHEDGMPVKSVINLDNILTIPVNSLGEKITELSPEKLAAVDKAIVFAIDVHCKVA
jgi:mRNA interferase MazF